MQATAYMILINSGLRKNNSGQTPGIFEASGHPVRLRPGTESKDLFSNVFVDLISFSCRLIYCSEYITYLSKNNFSCLVRENDVNKDRKETQMHKKTRRNWRWFSSLEHRLLIINSVTAVHSDLSNFVGKKLLEVNRISPHFHLPKHHHQSCSWINM